MLQNWDSNMMKFKWILVFDDYYFGNSNPSFWFVICWFSNPIVLRFLFFEFGKCIYIFELYTLEFRLWRKYLRWMELVSILMNWTTSFHVLSLVRRRTSIHYQLVQLSLEYCWRTWPIKIDIQTFILCSLTSHVIHMSIDHWDGYPGMTFVASYSTPNTWNSQLCLLIDFIIHYSVFNIILLY